MTLHNATETLKKTIIGGGIAIGALIIVVILFRVGVTIKNILVPPRIDPPTVAYDKLPALQFPPNATDESLIYTINTDSGDLPQDFPDRLNVFPIVHPEPNFLNLDTAKSKAKVLGFTSSSGQALPEVSLGNSVYEWSEQTGMRRKLTMNTITFDFDIESSFLTYLPVLNGQNLSQPESIAQATGLLTSIGLMPEDIDITKTETQNSLTPYVTYPQLFDIVGGQLTPVASLDKTKIVRVDLYQKNVQYDLATGQTAPGAPKTIPIDYPIVYPHPPFSTMNFLIGASGNERKVVQAKFFHQQISFPTDVSASYPLKPITQAYEELKNGEGYIAAYAGTDAEIFIKDIYPAYYLGETAQDYLMPIYVFEGDKGFFGYVSAITSEWVE